MLISIYHLTDYISDSSAMSMELVSAAFMAFAVPKIPGTTFNT